MRSCGGSGLRSSILGGLGCVSPPLYSLNVGGERCTYYINSGGMWASTGSLLVGVAPEMVRVAECQQGWYGWSKSVSTSDAVRRVRALHPQLVPASLWIVLLRVFIFFSHLQQVPCIARALV